jgi:hypothetical protein
MRYFVVCAAFLMLAGCGARQAPVPQTPEGTRSVVVNNDSLLEQARKQGRAGVGLVVSTVEGKTEEVAKALTALGGQVQTTDPRVGYLRVTLPTTAISDAKAIPSITAIDVEGLVDRIEPPS